MRAKPLVSVAIPAYNEERNLPELIERLKAVFRPLNERYDFEIVITENGSTDRTIEVLKQLRSQDQRIKIVQLVRNFNMEGGMMAALSYVTGDACIIMSADLQDPPELIPEMIKKWEDGFENVYTVVTKRHGESIFRRAAAQFFYWLLHQISDTPVPRNASDFRLVSRAAYLSFNQLPEKARLVRTVWAWLGFPSASIEYERPARTKGKSSFNPFVTAPYAIRAILGSSYTPMRIISVCGLTLAFLSFLTILVMTVFWAVFGVPFHGFGSIVSVLLLMFGLVFLFLGIVSEYIGMIYEEVRARPVFIVKQTEGLTES